MNICSPDSNQLLYFSRYLHPIDPSESTKGKAFFTLLSARKKPKTIKIPCNKVFSPPCRLDHINRKKRQITCINNDSQFTWTRRRQRVNNNNNNKREKSTRRSDFCASFRKFFFRSLSLFLPAVVFFMKHVVSSHVIWIMVLFYFVPLLYQFTLFHLLLLFLYISFWLWCFDLVVCIVWTFHGFGFVASSVFLYTRILIIALLRFQFLGNTHTHAHSHTFGPAWSICSQFSSLTSTKMPSTWSHFRRTHSPRKYMILYQPVLCFD